MNARVTREYVPESSFEFEVEAQISAYVPATWDSPAEGGEIEDFKSNFEVELDRWLTAERTRAMAWFKDLENSEELHDALAEDADERYKASLEDDV